MKVDRTIWKSFLCLEGKQWYGGELDEVKNRPVAEYDKQWRECRQAQEARL